MRSRPFMRLLKRRPDNPSPRPTRFLRSGGSRGGMPLACIVLVTTIAASVLTGAHAASAQGPGQIPLQVVAAENFYGNLVKELGGNQVAVESILSNPNQDPHSFEASPKVARALSRADLVVSNGADYDPWIRQLLSAAPHAGRTELVAATLVGKKAGDNPHLWYDPATLPAVAHAVTAFLNERDPAHRAEYARRTAAFLASLEPINEKIASLRSRYAGTKVTATEPVFGYMASAIGLDMQDQAFQLAVMNEAEPSASDIARFEQSLKNRTVKVLIYNAQTSDQMSRRLLQIARASGVAVVPVTETEPAGQTYQQWMLAQLDALEKALATQPK